MKKFCVQSLIIGIGMGMIMTASFNFLLDARSVPPEVALEGVPPVADTGIEKTIGNLKKNLETEKENQEDGMQEENLVENNKGNPQNGELEMVRVVIASGMNTNKIATLLWQEGLISDTEEFVNIAREKGYTKIFRAGRWEIPKDSTLEEILEILIKPPQ